MKSSSIVWADLDLPPINLYSFGVECSPCKKKCELKDGECLGCGRSLDEIRDWTIMLPVERWAVLQRLGERH